LIQDAVPALRPDEIVLVFYANDFAGEPPFTPAGIRPPFEPRYRPRLVAAHRAGGKAPSRERTGAAALARRSEAVSRGRARSVESLDRAAAPSSHLKVDPDIADAMRRGTFNPYAVDELDEYAYQFQRVVDVTTHLTFLRDFLKARDVRLRVAYLPYPGQVSDYYIPFKHRFGGRDGDVDERTAVSGPGRALAQVAARLAVPFLDLTPQIRARETAGEHLYWDYDHHLRPAGYAFVADALYAWAGAPPAK
jgi:hypothetical protein